MASRDLTCVFLREREQQQAEFNLERQRIFRHAAVRGDAGEIASLVNREAAHAATSIRIASASACEECGVVLFSAAVSVFSRPFPQSMLPLPPGPLRQEIPLARSVNYVEAAQCEYLLGSSRISEALRKFMAVRSSLIKLLQYHHNPLGGLPSERLRMMRVHSEGYRATTEFDSSMRNYEGLARLVSQLGSTPPEIAMEVAPLEEAVNQRLRALVELQRQAAAVKSTHTADTTVRDGLLRWLRNTINEGKFQIAVARKVVKLAEHCVLVGLHVPQANGNGAREAAEALLKLLMQSADLEESVSAVLIGPEGCGKSAALAAA
ncbi:origin recognition complex subunit 4, partial [Perkinsus olseni]